MPWDDHSDVDIEGIRTSLVMVSDSLFSGSSDFSEDESSNIAIDILNNIGILSINLDYYPDDFAALRSKIEDDSINDFDLIILIGGTGISVRDVSTEAVKSIIDKELPGFGEEFRRISFEQVKERGLLSRAVAGTYKKSLVVAIPGSPNATKAAVELIGRIVGHVLKLLRK